MSRVLRERTAGEVVGQSVSLLLSRFGSVLLIHILFWVPGSALMVYLSFAAAAADVAFAGFFISLIPLFLQPLPSAASILVLSDDFTGRRTSVSACIGLAFQRFFPVLWIGIVVGFLIGIGVALGVAAAIFFGFVMVQFGLIIGAAIALPFVLAVASSYFVAVQACLLEGRDSTSALSRSARLTKGGRFGIALLWSLIIGLSILVGFLFQGLSVSAAASRFDAMAWSMLQVFAGNTLQGMLFASAGVCVYFNQRAKKESFDVDQLIDLVDEIGARSR